MAFDEFKCPKGCIILSLHIPVLCPSSHPWFHHTVSVSLPKVSTHSTSNTIPEVNVMTPFDPPGLQSSQLSITFIDHQQSVSPVNAHIWTNRDLCFLLKWLVSLVRDKEVMATRSQVQLSSANLVPPWPRNGPKYLPWNMQPKVRNDLNYFVGLLAGSIWIGERTRASPPPLHSSSRLWEVIACRKHFCWRKKVLLQALQAGRDFHHVVWEKPLHTFMRPQAPHLLLATCMIF